MYQRVPHITLKSIANNRDIREGMTREEIDLAIRRHSNQELLYDQPYEDNKRFRVTGQFTVESLSPHRVLDPDEERPATEVAAETDPNAEGFVPTVPANLRKAGVQNTKQGERLTFGTLGPFAGAWIQASGQFTDKEGETKRVAVSIGPEHGTVGPTHVKEAAKEAVGAKLGAILRGFLRTAVDARGFDISSFQPRWTLLDALGHRLEIYGSGGWVFESPRARCKSPGRWPFLAAVAGGRCYG